VNRQELEQELEQIVFDRFYQTGEWPPADHVYTILIRRRPGIDLTLYELMKIFRVYISDAPLTLDVRSLQGIAQGSHEAEGLLNDFLSAIRLISEKQIQSTEDHPRISASDIKIKFPKYNDLEVRRLYQLIVGAWYFLGSGTGGDNFDQQISSEAHMFGSVTSIPEFLAVWDRVRGTVTVPTEKLGESEQPSKQPRTGKKTSY
jgi:hypothetical protein